MEFKIHRRRDKSLESRQSLKKLLKNSTKLGPLMAMISFFGCLVAIAISFSAPSVLAVNKVLSLDGDGDYVRIPYSESLNISNTITLETWVLRHSHDGVELIVGNGGGWAYPGYHIVSMPDGCIRFELKSVTAWTFLDSDVISDDNQWHHIAATYDGNMMTFYIDGILNKSTPHENGIEKQDADVGIGFGLYPPYSGSFFDGFIDEVRIWNVARTQEEIQANMGRPLENPELLPNLVGYWNFDGGTADDLSQYENHGDLYGDAYIADVFYVSSEYGSPDGDGTKENPYDTIQRGIDESGRGDIVQALPGTYEENIRLYSDLTVLGSVSENTTITAASGNIVTANDVHNVSFSGFTIDGQGSAENGILCSGTTSETEISSNVITGATTGVRCTDTSNPIIKNNEIRQNTWSGIVCQSSGSSMIAENSISQNGFYGIICQNSANPQISGNWIQENQEGVTIATDGSTVNLINNIVLRNTYGFVCTGSSISIITTNTIAFQYEGVICNVHANTTLQDNLIYNHNTRAISLAGSSDTLIVRNTIRDNSAGIGCFESANSVIGGSLVNANTLLDNGVNFLSNDTPNIINATFNYWGTIDEAEIAAMIQDTGGGSVKFKPFVTEYNKIVADTSGDGTVSAYDAALILQFVVGLIDTFPVTIPQSPDQITPRNYIISLPSLAAHAGKRIQAPVAISDANGLIAGGIILKYDPTVLKAVDVLPTRTLNGSYWKANTKLDGEIRFAFAFTSASGDTAHTTKPMFTVEFEILPNTTGKVSPLILDKVQFSESQSISKINGSVVVLPEKSMLLQNYPNPFNPETWIPYQLANDSLVVISIYNAKGQLIRTLNLGNQNAGIYMAKDKAAYWDGRDETGEKVASGVYFYTLQVEHQQNYNEGGTGKFISTRRMVILK